MTLKDMISVAIKRFFCCKLLLCDSTNKPSDVATNDIDHHMLVLLLLFYYMSNSSKLTPYFSIYRFMVYIICCITTSQQSTEILIALKYVFLAL